MELNNNGNVSFGLFNAYRQGSSRKTIYSAGRKINFHMAQYAGSSAKPIANCGGAFSAFDAIQCFLQWEYLNTEITGKQIFCLH